MGSGTKSAYPSGPGAVRTAMPDAELAAFYREVFMPLVRRATWRHRLSKEDARDVVQDAFLLAIQKIDAAGNPKAWLIQVVDHLALNHQRKQIRRSKLLSKWSRGDLEPGTDQRSVASRVQQP